jgi:hypothetical protein
MTFSFFHETSAQQASYRYRAAIPSAVLNIPMNNEQAEVWIIAKITKQTPSLMEKARQLGKRVIVDVCDAHLSFPWYQEAIRQADAVTCSSVLLAQFIEQDFGREASVIDDPYEFECVLPHVAGNNLLWFGHAQNYDGMAMFRESLKDYPLRLVSNIEGFIPWSKETMRDEFIKADIVLLPDSAPTKSANRAVEAIRQGCFVVATPHPSLEGIPGIWVGNLLEGVAWASTHHQEANQRLIQSQAYVQERFSPARVANVWKTLVTVYGSSWGAGTSPGPAGSTSMASAPEALLTS